MLIGGVVWNKSTCPVICPDECLISLHWFSIFHKKICKLILLYKHNFLCKFFLLTPVRCLCVGKHDWESRIYTYCQSYFRSEGDLATVPEYCGVSQLWCWGSWETSCWYSEHCPCQAPFTPTSFKPLCCPVESHF